MLPFHSIVQLSLILLTTFFHFIIINNIQHHRGRCFPTLLVEHALEHQSFLFHHAGVWWFLSHTHPSQHHSFCVMFCSSSMYVMFYHHLNPLLHVLSCTKSCSNRTSCQRMRRMKTLFCSTNSHISPCNLHFFLST